MDKPTLVYTATSINQRAVFVTRWQTIFAARKAIRAAIKHFRAHGLPCQVAYHGVHITTGEYEVELLFERGVEQETIIQAATTKPPCSNRGVTGI